MIMVNLYDVLINIAWIFTSCIFASILFSTGIHFKRLGWDFHALLLAMGAGTSIDFILNIISLTLKVNGKDPSFMNFFIHPVCVCTQSIMTIFAILHMLHVNIQQIKRLASMILLLLVLVSIYPFVYRNTLTIDQSFWDITNYTQFANTIVAQLITKAVNIIVIIYTAIAVVSIVKGFRHYCDVACMYFSIDLGSILKRSITWLALGVLYTLFSVMSFLIPILWLKPIHYYPVTIIFGAMVILILCNHENLECIEKAFRYIRRTSVEVVPGSGDGIIISMHKKPQPEDVKQVRCILEHWINHSEKSFMQRGITLQTVSNEIGLPQEVVHKYVEIIYNMSFHDWIIDLRNQEAE